MEGQNHFHERQGLNSDLEIEYFLIPGINKIDCNTLQLSLGQDMMSSFKAN